MLSIVYLVVGLVLILVGANALTDGSASIARRMGISDLVVGLTVVAFGTSAPELVISVISAINGSSELAVGNVVGSNIFNILVIVGVTALVVPIKVGKSVMSNEIPLVLLSSVVLLVMANSPLLDGTTDSVVTRVDGLVLLLFFAVFMRYTFSQAKQPEPEIAEQDPAAEDASSRPEMKTWKAVLYVVGGLAFLIFGGDRFVAGASEIALSVGVSQAVVGLTIVAAGTSLPELATSVTAAIKGRTGIAIGNAIGSCIFNVFMVLGLSATISPLPLGSIGNVDLLLLTGSAILFWIFGWFYGHRTITRVEGALLLLCYIGYVSWLVVNA
ncbi:MAG: calcium/sodium antiporter [Bacteroides sp.]|nr:calcium/sodium antiporter [Bacteroides sp.]MCM1414134.1 calcium/sodium antiporter [Bacteroides sp.]MCM1471000.1 calcium/sodium antiporter [Bacteroides sp.]